MGGLLCHYMLPASPADNVANGRRIDTVFLAEYNLCHAFSVKLVNLQNILGGEFVIPTRLALDLPTLVHLVTHVFGKGSKKQIIRTNARRVVTLMKNMKISWIAKVNQPRNAVGQFQLFSKCAHLSVAWIFSRESSILTSVPSPQPTRAVFLSNDRSVFVDPEPETYFKRLFFGTGKSSCCRIAVRHLGSSSESICLLTRGLYGVLALEQL
jgi:hypothetical protein